MEASRFLFWSQSVGLLEPSPETDEVNLREYSSDFTEVMTRGIASKRPQLRRSAAAKD